VFALLVFRPRAANEWRGVAFYSFASPSTSASTPAVLRPFCYATRPLRAPLHAGGALTLTVQHPPTIVRTPPTPAALSHSFATSPLHFCCLFLS